MLKKIVIGLVILMGMHGMSDFMEIRQKERESIASLTVTNPMEQGAHGMLKTFYPGGILKTEDTYKHGRITKRTFHTINGNVLFTESYLLPGFRGWLYDTLMDDIIYKSKIISVDMSPSGKTTTQILTSSGVPDGIDIEQTYIDGTLREQYFSINHKVYRHKTYDEKGKLIDSISEGVNWGWVFWILLACFIWFI